MNTLYQYILFTSFIVSYIAAFIQLAYKNKISINYYFFGFFVTGGYQFFYLWMYGTGILEYIPFLYNSEIIIAFLMGPFIYFYFCGISGAKNMKLILIPLHFIPFAVSMIYIIVINTQIPSIYSFYLTNRPVFTDYSHNIYLTVINILGDISLVTYTFLTLLKVSIFFKTKKSRHQIKIILFFLFYVLINMILMIISYILNHPELKMLNCILYAVVPVFLIFFSFRNPEFSIKVIREAKSIRYKISISKKHNTSLIINRLIQLMEEEKFYAKEDISLKTLSNNLLITPHELSHILNDHFKKNYNTLINYYRIKEAKRLLVLNPEKNILEIAFSVGFNSKSSFYSSFIKETEESPSEYRKRTLLFSKSGKKPTQNTA